MQSTSDMIGYIIIKELLLDFINVCYNLVFMSTLPIIVISYSTKKKLQVWRWFALNKQLASKHRLYLQFKKLVFLKI